MPQAHRDLPLAVGDRLADDCPLHLLQPPHIRYASSVSLARRSARTWADGWRRTGSASASFDTGLVVASVTCEPAAADAAAQRQHTLALSITALEPVRIARTEIEVAFPCELPPVALDRTLRAVDLHAPISLGDYTPLFVRWRAPDGAVCDLRAQRGFPACRLTWEQGWLRVGVTIDAAALHPRWQFRTGRRSAAAPHWATGQELTVCLMLAQSARESAIAVLGRYPAGAEAAFTLTDHCDFDTEDRLRVFLEGDGNGSGWLGHGLRLTKSVFAFEGRQRVDRPAATLRAPAYRTMIRALTDEGSEIAPHSLNEWGTLDEATFATELTRLAREWSPRTWIDHGYLPYNYSCGGGIDPRYRLLQRLTELGFETIAAGHDIPTDACASLNMLAPAPAARPVTRTALRHVANGRPSVAMRYVRAAMRPYLGGSLGYLLDGALLSLADAVKGPHRMSYAHWVESWSIVWRRLQMVRRDGAQLFQVPYTRAELLELAAVAYPERAVPLHQAAHDELMLFTTLEAIHTQDIYNPRALGSLVTQRGLHIGHTYLLNELRYIAGVFDRSSAVRRLSTEWRQFVDALADAVAKGHVWNPPVSDLVAHMRHLQHVALRPGDDGRSVLVTNRAPQRLANVTLLLPRATHPADVSWDGRPPLGCRQWNDWLAVWGDVAAGATAHVRWNPVGQESVFDRASSAGAFI